MPIREDGEAISWVDINTVNPYTYETLIEAAQPRRIGRPRLLLTAICGSCGVERIWNADNVGNIEGRRRVRIIQGNHPVEAVISAVARDARCCRAYVDRDPTTESITISFGQSGRGWRLEECENCLEERTSRERQEQIRRQMRQSRITRYCRVCDTRYSKLTNDGKPNRSCPGCEENRKYDRENYVITEQQDYHRTQKIRPFYTKRLMTGLPLDNTLYIGVELEAQYPSNWDVDEQDEFCKDLGDMTEKSWYPEHDSSLSNGVELISCACTRDCWEAVTKKRALLPMRIITKELLRHMRFKKFKSHNAQGNYGMHVSVSSQCVPKVQRFKLVNLVLQNRAKFVFISQRTLDSLAQYADIPSLEKREVMRHVHRLDEHKYNWLYKSTGRLEFRLFRGNIREERFYKNLECVFALLDWSRTVKFEHSDSFESWLVFISQRSEQYPNLWQFLDGNMKKLMNYTDPTDVFGSLAEEDEDTSGEPEVRNEPVRNRSVRIAAPTASSIAYGGWREELRRASRRVAEQAVQQLLPQELRFTRDVAHRLLGLEMHELSPRQTELYDWAVSQGYLCGCRCGAIHR